MIRKLMILTLLLIIGVAIAIGMSFRRADLTVDQATINALPAPPAIDGLKLFVINTADIHTTEGIRVRGGDLGKPVSGPVSAILIDHPEGRYLIDAGLGRDAAEHFAGESFMLQALTDLEFHEAAVDILTSADIQPSWIKGIILTHVHWDHVSGVADFPDTELLITAAEQQFIASQHEMSALFHRINNRQPIKTRVIKFGSGPYGPWSQSHDLFGDGSVLLLPQAGHTPGSLSVLVNMPDGQRWLFIGDLAWSIEGINWPAERPWLPRKLADIDAEQVRDGLVMVHKLLQQHPELHAVPAHDPTSQRLLPTLTPPRNL